MDNVVNVDMSLGSLAVLISGLYIHNTGISIEAIPTSLFIEIAEIIQDYLPFNVDDFVNTLIIAPKPLFTEEELMDCQKNELYIERQLGNAVLIATGKVVR